MGAFWKGQPLAEVIALVANIAGVWPEGPAVVWPEGPAVVWPEGPAAGRGYCAIAIFVTAILAIAISTQGSMLYSATGEGQLVLYTSIREQVTWD